MKKRTWVVAFAIAFAASIAIPAISGAEPEMIRAGSVLK